ncbi:MAG: hypothetical protein KC912_15125 [Proteobacteria bacterium]|nr:hypothetical protein [Pseudomonadota bacterium]
MSRNVAQVAKKLSTRIEAMPSRRVLEHAARNELFDELLELASAIDGVVGQRLFAGGVAMGFAGRSLTLLPEGSADIRISYPGCGDEALVRDPTGRWMWKSPAGRAFFNEAGIEGLLSAALDLDDPDQAEEATVTEQSAPKGPRDGDPAHMGRSGTRGVRKSRDLPPGGFVKDHKGPFG